MNEFCLPPSAVINANAQLINNQSNLISIERLESALAAPLQTFGGTYLIPSSLERVAALLNGVIKAHAFIDGNKRMGWLCAVTYLEMEGFELNHISETEIVEFVEEVAKAKGRYSRHQVAQWFAKRLT